ncbi:Hint domain-containing protein [Rhodoblastus acidophilus]|uniref:Hint domain-containing protein n=1 Tax=Rhodoblastus acidophilus TaxID=1074 RepID=UPI0022244C96
MGSTKVAARFAEPIHFYPVRIKAGALGEGVPSRDLPLSTDHAVLTDDVLVQAGARVDGGSILRETHVLETFVYDRQSFPGETCLQKI